MRRAPPPATGLTRGVLPFRRVAVIGVGLIGGSIGLGLKQRFEGAVEVVGTDPTTSAAAAVQCGAVDRFVGRAEEACESADLVVLAAPAAAVVELLPIVRSATPAGVVVTDVAGVKASICTAGRRALDGHGTFVGGHPMAGAESSGLSAARADLFEGAAWALCPAADTTAAAMDGVGALVNGLGAHPVVLDAARHDHAVACISHLPQLMAVALLNLVAEDGDASDLLSLAGRGFRDMTRVGSSPFGTWRDVLAENRAPVQEALHRLSALLEKMDTDLHDGGESLAARFEAAGACRSELPSL